jgi:hypothetical protein
MVELELTLNDVKRLKSKANVTSEVISKYLLGQNCKLKLAFMVLIKIL